MAKKFVEIPDPRFQPVEGTCGALAVGIVAVYPDGAVPEEVRVLEHTEYARKPANTLYVAHPGRTLPGDDGVQRIAFPQWVDWTKAHEVNLVLRRDMAAPRLCAAQAGNGGKGTAFDKPEGARLRFVNIPGLRAEGFLPISFRLDCDEVRYFQLSFQKLHVPIVSIERVERQDVPRWLHPWSAERAVT